MKWLKSTTQKTWIADGKKIPACITPNNDYLVLDDSAYANMIKSPVIQSLIKAGGILVLDTEPAEIRNSLDNLQESNVQMRARISELETRLQEAEKGNGTPVDVEAIKAQAQEEIKAQAIAELQEKEDRIKELEKKLKAAEKKAAKADDAE